MAAPRILVVEDNPVTRKMLRIALEAERFHVLEAPDAATALDLVDRSAPSLILQDLMLPDMDGIELVRRLRSHPSCNAVPILALSGFLAKMEEARTLGAGFTSFLVKPVEPSRLVEVIRSFLPAGHPRAPEIGQGRKVLVVDDDPVQLHLLSIQLGHEGFEVLRAADAEEALRAARDMRPEAIVSDVLMPGMDGFELCLALRRDHELGGVPVILHSFHYLESDDLELARTVGASRFLQRGADPGPLCAAIMASVAEGVPPLKEPVHLLRNEHAARVSRQLERQVAANEGLARRCAFQAAEISLLCGVANALSRSAEIDRALRDVLASCFDAAGISRGGLYLKEGRRLVLRDAIGYGEGERVALQDFFGHAELLESALAGDGALPVPSADIPPGVARAVLSNASLETILLVPLVSAGERLGVLFVGSRTTDVTGPEEVEFARALAGQIGQAVALAAAFDRLARSEQHYRALMEKAFDGISVLGEDGRIVEVNHAWERLLGRCRKDAIGRHPSEFVVPEMREGTIARLRSLRGEVDSVRSGDVRIARPDGSEVIADFTTSVVETHGERMLLAVARDMTERRATEDALRASEARFRSLVESMDDFVFTLDSDERYTAVHGRWLELAGLPAGAFLGKTATEILGADRARPHVAANARALAGEHVVYEWSLPGEGGERHFQTSLSAIEHAAGCVAGVVGVSRDVTEQKRLQAQLMVSDRMVSVGMLAAGVAHEINNPLTAVMGNLDLAVRTLGEDRPCLLEEVLEELGDAREAAERVRQIVRDLRVFSRAQEERTGPVDLHEILDSTLRMAWNEIRHRAKLTRRFGRVPPVQGIEARLGQTFLNLVVNAAQAIPEGHAEANEIRVATGLDDRGRVFVDISDTGSGISPENLSRLFTPFFTTKPSGVGTGLGLSICQRIVTALGGDISVESRVGEGTTFRVILLPARGEAEPPPAPLAAAARAARRGRVLVVDDEPAMGRIVRRTLEAEHDVVEATRAADALERLRGGDRFDVILCDLMMPDLTGMDLHAELTRIASDQAARMVFLTGGAFTPRGRAFLDEVPNLRIEKPFDPLNLRALVNDRVR